jgi:hypothetical protein
MDESSTLRGRVVLYDVFDSKLLELIQLRDYRSLPFCSFSEAVITTTAITSQTKDLHHVNQHDNQI